MDNNLISTCKSSMHVWYTIMCHGMLTCDGDLESLLAFTTERTTIYSSSYCKRKISISRQFLYSSYFGKTFEDALRYNPTQKFALRLPSSAFVLSKPPFWKALLLGTGSHSYIQILDEETYDMEVSFANQHSCTCLQLKKLNPIFPQRKVEPVRMIIS